MRRRHVFGAPDNSAPRSRGRRRQWWYVAARPAGISRVGRPGGT